jgi:hypothetical protein
VISAGTASSLKSMVVGDLLFDLEREGEVRMREAERLESRSRPMDADHARFWCGETHEERAIRLRAEARSLTDAARKLADLATTST